MTYIKDLMRVHVMLDDMFFDHQKALLHFDFEKALSLLEIYEATLLHHMQDEEMVLLPVYSERATQSGAGSPKLFFDDHSKMRSFVKLFKETTATLDRETNVDKVLLQLLDREAFYLRLCSHHDKREADFLYPTLEQILSDDEELELMSRIELNPDEGDASVAV